MKAGTMRVSQLNQQELDAHDTLVKLAGKLFRLSPVGLEKVFERWDMLHMVEGEEHQFFRKWLKRVTGAGTNFGDLSHDITNR